MGQISALANTFRRDRKQSLANLVRAIRFDMCVVLTHCAKVVREDFEYILAHCRMLHTYVFIPHPQFSFQPYDFACGAVPVPTDPTAFNPTWILDLRRRRAGSLLAQSINSRLVTLHLDLTTYEGSFSPLAHLLSSTPCLTSLELGSLSPPGRPDNPPSAPSHPLRNLSFPALKTLSIYCDFPPFVHYVTAQWTMPRLASLTCMASDHVSIPISLLDAHGKQLEYLHFMHTGEPHNLLANTVLLPRLHELCPRIIHLVLPIVPEERPALNIHSPTLLYLDICTRPSVAAYRAVAVAPTAHAPQLKKVRMVLDVCAFVPRYFHPAHMPGADRALEDVEHIPGMETPDAQANWLLSTSGGTKAEFSEWRVRQHSWAVTLDPTGVGVAASAFPPAAGEDPDEIDSSGEYEYESLPPSPADSDTSGDEAEDDERPGGHSDAGSDADSDLERAWITVRAAAPPVPARIVFVDDLLDSTGRQYDRETVLERFSRSQLGDFLLD
ncbi:hypothetical protein GSI_09563 [Ganoderma sinense ZZ0214-1]|uniref:F-box domain-containing protein n=1 Tax=Ganoderma sinense ZZ0214-1 TaxID=1077348 RepID=A0A2G8S3F1_9APHY|nr:hypothetical protein GSI_09563 [Ganoderma sinense ZZ0214-1]